ncbi:MAG: imidazolonepropionase [Lapillicoccus sp.]
MTLLVTDIGELSTMDDDLDEIAGADGTEGLGLLHDAAVVVEDDGTILWVGPADRAPDADRCVALGGRAVIPAFVDSHTHLVFAGDRAPEFAARMTGRAYDGGGIATTVAATRAASDDELRVLLQHRLGEMRRQGTGVVEIKSGYGLDVAAETRLMRLAAEVTDEVTFLGAHVVPPDYDGRREDYLALVTGPMLDAARGLARWIDVFCEPHSPHAFTAEEARVVLEAGRAAGLGLRVHGNQLGPGPGVRLAVEVGAASVDHCTHLTRGDVDALAGAASTATPTSATLLPGVEFSTRSPYPDVRRLLDAGVPVALATDCNPGTCYSSSMPFAIALAVREMGMTPAEALRAATRGAATSLRRRDIGRIVVGGRPGLTTLDAPSHLHLAYRPGVPLARLLDPSADTSPAAGPTPSAAPVTGVA